MNRQYPQNLVEELVMGLPNAMTMVLGMVTLNLWIYGALTPGHWIRVVPMMFVVAFALDFLIAGPLVTRIVSRYNIPKLMPVIRVALMAGTLTFVAPLLEAGRIVTAQQYFTALPRNYVAALLLQVLVAMRIGMYVFARYKSHMARARNAI